MRSYRGTIDVRLYAENDEQARKQLEYLGSLVEGQAETITVWVTDYDYMDYPNPYFSDEPLVEV